jgi:ArsR family transcriptional regulator, lead/cadmium/zinc/bismuth-responsive transcriptional repressor
MKDTSDICQEFCVNPESVTAAISDIPNQQTLELLSRMFKALSDGTRLKILLSVAERELCVCELGEVLSMSAPAVSHHLRMLKDLGLVRTRRDRKWVYYTLDDDHVRVLLQTAVAHLQHTHQR